MTYALALFSIALGAVGQFLLKVGAGKLTPGALWRMALIPEILIGLVCFGLSFISWVFVLQRLPLSVAYPMVSLSYVIVTALAAIFLGESIGWQKLAGLALILVGVVVLQWQGWQGT